MTYQIQNVDCVFFTKQSCRIGNQCAWTIHNYQLHINYCMIVTIWLKISQFCISAEMCTHFIRGQTPPSKCAYLNSCWMGIEKVLSNELLSKKLWAKESLTDAQQLKLPGIIYAFRNAWFCTPASHLSFILLDPFWCLNWGISVV